MYIKQVSEELALRLIKLAQFQRNMVGHNKKRVGNLYGHSFLK